MKLFRSVTARLVFFYCLLLAVLGGAFMLYTVLSFRHYARDTVSSPIPCPHPGDMGHGAKLGR